MDLVVTVEVDHPLQVRFQQDGEVRPYLRGAPEAAQRLDEGSQVRVQLGRSAGDVYQGGAGFGNRLQDHLHGRPFHHLAPVGGGVYVAVPALLIASQPDVHLHRLNLDAPQTPASPGCYDLFETVGYHQFRAPHKPSS